MKTTEYLELPASAMIGQRDSEVQRVMQSLGLIFLLGKFFPLRNLELGKTGENEFSPWFQIGYEETGKKNGYLSDSQGNSKAYDSGQKFPLWEKRAVELKSTDVPGLCLICYKDVTLLSQILHAKMRFLFYRKTRRESPKARKIVRVRVYKPVNRRDDLRPC